MIFIYAIYIEILYFRIDVFIKFIYWYIIIKGVMYQPVFV